MAGGTNNSLNVSPQLLGNGSHMVSAQVKDLTTLVRNDPTNLLSQSITWNLNVTIPQLQLDNPLWLAGGKFAFRIHGTAPQGFVIQGSTNLVNWVPLSTNTLAGGQFWYTNSGVSGMVKRFYRAVTTP